MELDRRKDPWTVRRWYHYQPARGPTVWGEVLFEEPPNGMRMALHFLLSFLLLMPLTIFLVPLGHAAISEEVGVTDPLVLIMLVVGLSMSLLFLFMSRELVRYARERPFRIYERGFSHPEVPFLTAVLGREVLVPASSVIKVRFRRGGRDEGASRSILVEYTDGEGRRCSMAPEKWTRLDQLDLISALDRMVPGRLDGELTDLLEPGAELDAHDGDDEPVEEGAFLRWFSLGLVSMPAMFLGFFCAILVDVDLGTMGPGDIGDLLLFGGMFLGGGLFMAWFIHRLLPEFYTGYWAHEGARATSRGVQVNAEGPLMHFLETKDPVPYADVRRIRRRLTPGSYTARYQALATGGLAFLIHEELFESIVGRSEFRRDGLEHVNTVPVPDGVPPMVSVRTGRFTVFMVMCTLLWTDLLLFLFSITEYVEALQVRMAPVCISVMGAILVVLVAFMLRSARTEMRKKAMAARSQDFHVDQAGLRIPNAPEGMSVVSRYDVGSITVRGFPGGSTDRYLDLRTSRGRVDLPVSLVEDIREAGYLVEDPDGLMTDMGDDAEEPSEMRWFSPSDPGS